MPADADRPAHRFLVGRLGSPGERVDLEPGEANHLARVLRLGVGSRVALFDGRGREWLAEVSRAHRSQVTVTLLEPLEPAREPHVAFTLAQAVLKGPAMDAAVRDAVMMGASAFVPVTSAHVTVKGRAIDRPESIDRWRRIALASTKQCRRAVLPAVEPPHALHAVVTSAQQDVRLIFVEPQAGGAARTPRRLLELATPRTAALLVGPEGGWSADEIAGAVTAGWIPVTLGTLTLRADAMALCAGALVRFLWED